MSHVVVSGGSRQPITVSGNSVDINVTGGIGPQGPAGAGGVTTLQGLAGALTLAVVGGTVAASGSTITITVTGGGGGASAWGDLTGKPFTSVGTGLTVTGGVLTGGPLAASLVNIDTTGFNEPGNYTATVQGLAAWLDGEWADVVKATQLAAVATSGSYADLTNKPASMEWSADTITQAEAEAGTATTRRAFTALRVFQAIAAWWAGSSAKTKLDGIATGATANQTDAYLLARGNHTGTQDAATITGLATVATSGAYADLSGAPAAYSLPTASASTLGGVKIGAGVLIDGSSIISVSTNYQKPITYGTAAPTGGSPGDIYLRYSA